MFQRPDFGYILATDDNPGRGLPKWLWTNVVIANESGWHLVPKILLQQLVTY